MSRTFAARTFAARSFRARSWSNWSEPEDPDVPVEPTEPDDDPFSQVYTALADLAAASVPLSSIVKVRNLIRFDSRTNRNVEKQTAADADLPELVLLPDTGTVAMHNTSSSSRVIRQYVWKLNTGDYRLVRRLHPVEWMLACAMTGWKAELGRLTWKGQSFVTRSDIISVAAGESDNMRNDGIRGWSAIWRCEVEMHFRTNDMIQYHTGA